MISRERRFKRRFNFEFPTGEGSRKCWAARGSFDVFKTAVIWTETGGREGRGGREGGGVEEENPFIHFSPSAVFFHRPKMLRTNDSFASVLTKLSCRFVRCSSRTHLTARISCDGEERKKELSPREDKVFHWMAAIIWSAELDLHRVYTARRWLDV